MVTELPMRSFGLDSFGVCPLKWKQKNMNLGKQTTYQDGSQSFNKLKLCHFVLVMWVALNTHNVFEVQTLNLILQSYNSEYFTSIWLTTSSTGPSHPVYLIVKPSMRVIIGLYILNCKETQFRTLRKALCKLIVVFTTETFVWGNP